MDTISLTGFLSLYFGFVFTSVFMSLVFILLSEPCVFVLYFLGQGLKWPSNTKEDIKQEARVSDETSHSGR